MLNLKPPRSRTLLLALPTIAAAWLAFAGGRGWLLGPGFDWYIVPFWSGDRGVVAATLAIPAFSVAWTHFMMIEPLRQLAESELREEMSLTYLPAAEWLRRNLARPLAFLFLPSLLAFPLLCAALSDHRLVSIDRGPNLRRGRYYAETFFVSASKSEADRLAHPSYSGRKVFRLYPPAAAIALPVLLAATTLLIGAAGFFSSLARLCQVRSYPMRSMAYASAWIAAASLLPFLVHCFSNKNWADARGAITPDAWTRELTFICYPLGADWRSWVASIVFAIAAGGYALFRWRRLCAAYYRFE